MIDKKFNEKEIIIINCISKVLTDGGFSLVDLEIDDEILISIFVYNKLDNNIEKLSKLNKNIYPLLEKLDILKDDFSLEVSSPGIYRNIKRYEEFNIFCDKEIKLTLNDKNIITGIINKFENNILDINVLGKFLKINIEDIKSAGLNG